MAAGVAEVPADLVRTSSRMSPAPSLCITAEKFHPHSPPRANVACRPSHTELNPHGFRAGGGSPISSIGIPADCLKDCIGRPAGLSSWAYDRPLISGSVRRGAFTWTDARPQRSQRHGRRPAVRSGTARLGFAALASRVAGAPDPAPDPGDAAGHGRQCAACRRIQHRFGGHQRRSRHSRVRSRLRPVSAVPASRLRSAPRTAAVRLPSAGVGLCRPVAASGVRGERRQPTLPESAWAAASMRGRHLRRPGPGGPG